MRYWIAIALFCTVVFGGGTWVKHQGYLEGQANCPGVESLLPWKQGYIKGVRETTDMFKERMGVK